MDAEETLVCLKECGALLDGDHFVYVTGDHGSGWVSKDDLFPHPRKTDRLATLLAERVRGWGAEMVCGPATGGLILAQWVARCLDLDAVYCEHDDTRPDGRALRGRFALRRGFDRRVAGRRVLVVDDVVNTGHSLREAAEAVRAAGGTVAGAACLVSRGNVGAEEMGVERYEYLLEVKIPSWPAEECPLCRDGVPINTRYAHGADFVAQQELGAARPT